MEHRKEITQSYVSTLSTETAKPTVSCVRMFPEIQMVAEQPQPCAWNGESWLPALLLTCVDDFGDPRDLPGSLMFI